MNKELLIKEQGLEAFEFITKFTGSDFETSLTLRTNDVFNIESIEANNYQTIVNLNKINDINGINRFLSTVNSKLPEGGIYINCVETYLQRKKRLLKKYPFAIAQIYIFLDFVFKRIFPKLGLTRRLYFFLTAGRNRVLSKAEALGRIVFNGFDIIELKEIGSLTYFVCKKTTRPIPDKVPSFGFFFKMKRIGKNNKLITVYKIRTMHPYAEYIQSYIFENNNLREGGKIKDDYRITSWGKVFRKLWIDELPMAVNFIKGEVKLVGVRPLSQHYLSLYSDELQQKRVQAKPGLIPPFYADLPVTLEDIMQSELNYLDAYQKHPLKTDTRYLFKAIKNILFKNARTN
ncbi:MAG: sugar transferase [Bacteroidetes bacterium]|nr:sugar transferase [Bacteroidota bacterium]